MAIENEHEQEMINKQQTTITPPTYINDNTPALQNKGASNK
jgi:hypothetical protein